MDLNELKQKVNRVFGLIYAWINFIPEFFSSTPKDVTVTWANEDGSTTTQVHPNLKKMLQNIETNSLWFGTGVNRGHLASNAVLLYARYGTPEQVHGSVNMEDSGDTIAIGQIVGKDGNIVSHNLVVYRNGDIKIHDENGNARGNISRGLTGTSWVDKTSSRTAGVNYINNTGHTIFVAIRVGSGDDNVTDRAYFLVDDEIVNTITRGQIGTDNVRYDGGFITPVPAGSTYKLLTYNDNTITQWKEMM